MKKTIAVNRQASFEYFIEEKLEAGIVLEGAEVKSLRQGNCSLKDSFCYLTGGEMGAFNSHNSKRDRKLLLHKSEIARIAGKVNAKGFTVVPLSLYFSDGLVKAEIALCRGKQTYDKKRTIKERDIKRDTERQLKEY